ncbi:interferon alpha-21-like [Neoarius graeffei]|uniref:interferon alpha-21-like n=1 Tax=Neoarius graeffei TaxID=443677 RepID=UPI00298CFF1A|nr:interferon alpha-21-like [Neoarius graeffei]
MGHLLVRLFDVYQQRSHCTSSNLPLSHTHLSVELKGLNWSAVLNMELVNFVLLLVLVLSEAAALPSCIWTHTRLKTLNKQSNELLKNMGGHMPLECLERNNNSFPKGVFVQAQDEDLVLVALETLKGVEKIFKNNKASVTWDREKVSRFTNLINRQVEKLQECVGKKVQRAMETPAESSTHTLRSYFQKLEERLKEKEFSSCGWEMVRTELQDGLKEFQTFLHSRN